MKLTKDELLKKLKDRVGEDTSDETISFIEDITDTINDYEERVNDTTNWKQKYTENDEAWKKKYRDRFFNTPVKEDEQIDDTDDDKPKQLTFDDLFKTKE
jgi:hypothetical protein